MAQQIDQYAAETDAASESEYAPEDRGYVGKILAQFSGLRSLAGLAGRYLVAAVGITGVVFADYAATPEDACALAAELRRDVDETSGRECWRQIVIYDDHSMEVVDQLDLTDRRVFIDAPLLEPLTK